MSRGLRRLALLGLLCIQGHAQTPRSWTLAANSHFEVYGQAGPESARTALAWFERLRTWLVRETALRPDRTRPARVIGFASAAEYLPYRLRSSADAYYVGTEGRDYIVMALAGPSEFGIAAHEYAHLVMHAAGLELPPWLGEGLAELFATVRIDERGGTLGGDRPEHSQLLRRRPGMPLPDLLRLTADGRNRLAKDETALFYAQSWALADMLAFSPDYQPRLRALVASLAARLPGDTALASVYGKPLDRIADDLLSWTARRKVAHALAAVADAPDLSEIAVSEVPAARARGLIASLLLDAGELARAEALSRELLRDAPGNGDIHAALGTIAFQKGDRAAARERWARALELGVSDDALCYRYSVLAQNAGIAAEEMRPVLERAVVLRPGFDDAHYSLALMDKNAGRPAAAIEHLRAIREPPPARAFAYWAAMSDALDSLDRHEEAEAAAHTAATHATTPEERERAAQLAYFARTEIAVQLAHDAAGRTSMVTTRVPRRTADWNPFIEPGDEVRRADGLLREIECGGGPARIVVETAAGRLALAIVDPSHVQMRNAPAEFTCGPQAGSPVTVVYAAGGAADGTVRGIEFH